MTAGTPPPQATLQIDAPPHAPGREGAGSTALAVVPLLGGLGSVALFAGLGGQGVLRYVAAGLVLLATCTAVVLQVDQRRVARAESLRCARAGYLRHLSGMRGRARDAARAQCAQQVGLHPSPEVLPCLAADPTAHRFRNPEDPAFLQVRWATGSRPATLRLLAPEHDPDADPACAALAERLVAAHTDTPGVPVTVDLRAHPRLALTGPDRRAHARALVCSAVAAHRPEHLRVAVLAESSALPAWDWCKWLPHCASPTVEDGVGPCRLVRDGWAELQGLLPPPGAGASHVLLVADGVTPPHVPAGATVLTIGDPGTDDHELLAEHGATPDRCDVATAEALARRLAAPDVGTPDAADLLAAPGADGRLRAPIGVGEGGPVVLDLEEAARGGMGPHGLLVGATGSGKSELLRTLVLGLALAHAPDRLNLVLVDFKGGATFAGLAGLPHVAALITNLDGDRALVERMQDALSGELVRRQELLRARGHGSVHDHETARRAGASLPPIPSLLVVVDEFSELLAAEPALIDLFVSIGRLGRGLGIHLLLASQRLEEGRLRGLESHLSYRIGLRTFNAQDSRAVLGVPDAYELPAVPGVGYLRTDSTTLRRFTTTYVSGPASTPTRRREAAELLPFTLLDAGVSTRHRRPLPDTASFLDLAVARLARSAPQAHQIWLAPLGTPPRLAGPAGLIHDLRADPLLGLVSRRWRGVGPWVVPVAIIDRPREQRREVLRLDLRGADGHVAVVGAPRSGKSTLLQSIAVGLSLTSTPLETQLYLLDLGGGLAPLAALPHRMGGAGRSEPDLVRRIVEEVTRLLARREAHFRREGIDSIETYRRRRADGDPGDGYGEVFLVVDDWGTLRADHDDLEPRIVQLQARGLAFGFHVLASALRWSDFRASTRDLFGSRVELRLGDPMDSEAGRAAAARVPRSPGRGVTPDGAHLLAALPNVDELVPAVVAGWRGPAGPRLRVLPPLLRLDDMTCAAPSRGLVLGVDEDLEAVRWDVDADPHLLVLGDRGSGRTGLLRSWCHQVVATRSPREARLLLVDPRRGLLGEVPGSHLLGHLTSAAHAEEQLTELAGYLARRLPGPSVTTDQLRSRSWWTGAEVFVLVDDHDLLATSSGSPLAPLLPLVPHARDVGLHLVLARRTGGAGRALLDPVLQTLSDLGQPGLLLSGDPAEGPLIGGLRPVRAPPGRARLVTRDAAPRTVQLVWTDPSP